MNPRILSLYFALLLAHTAHIFEEIWGNFRVLKVFGLGGFLIANWILYAIPLIILYYLIQGKNWAHYLALGYSGIMVLNGLGHNIAYILTGQYFGAFAGNFTGIALILIGIPLSYYIIKRFSN
jgi:hypothetical protein